MMQRTAACFRRKRARADTATAHWGGMEGRGEEDYGVCADAQDMKIDGVLENVLEVNQDEEYEADEWVFGRWLDGDNVRSATWRKNWTCSSLPLGECVEKTGRQPKPTKWVDVNKGTVQNQFIRSRPDRSDPFAAMPLWGGRMLFRIVVRRCREKP